LSKKTRMMESFGSRVRDEVLSVETFDSVLEAQTVITDWRTIYNHRRPHSSLGWRPPAAYAVRQAALVPPTPVSFATWVWRSLEAEVGRAAAPRECSDSGGFSSQ
jgi:transposase InsO family protein